MRTIKVALPEKLGMELENYVKSGWFTDEGELVRTALQERNSSAITDLN